MANPGNNPFTANWGNPTLTEWIGWNPSSGTPAPMDYGDIRTMLQKSRGITAPQGSQERALFLDFIRNQGTTKYPTDPYATDEQLRLSKMNNSTRANLLANEKNPQWFKDYWAKKTDADFAATQARMDQFRGGPVVPPPKVGVTASTSGTQPGSQIIQRNPDGSIIYKGANPYGI